jgi:hypothetical protein
MMIVVNYSKELREAFNAGMSAGMAKALGKKWPLKTPLTYDEWISSISDRPPIAIG